MMQCELLPSLGICRPLTFHILIFSSEIPQPNEQSTNQKQELPVTAMFVNKSGRCEQIL
jgi:hypothetical protein